MNDIPVPLPEHPRQQAVLFHNKAIEIAKTDPQLSYKLFVSSVEVDPMFPEGWGAIGSLNSDINNREAAVAAFRRVLEITPDDYKSLTGLGHSLYHLGRHQEAKAVTLKAVELSPEPAYPLCNLSLIYSVEGDNYAAINAAQQAYELMPNDATVEITLAFAHLFAGYFAKGLKHLESRFPYRLQQYLSMPWQMWKGEDVAGKKVFIIAEQGMGDTLSFTRFIPKVLERGCEVTVQVQPELLRLVGAMFHGTKNLGAIPLSVPYPEADYWCAMTSMPHALGLSTREIVEMPGIPVPSPPLGEYPKWKARNRRLHIGVCWSGSAQNDIDRWRSFDVKHFLALYDVPGIQLYNLQVGDKAKDLHNAGAASLIRDMSPYIRDALDTMTIVRDLDLVITCETSLGHICGAIDAECWILASYNGRDYRIGGKGDKSIWYPRHRVFRQSAAATWEPVFRDVIKALRKRMGI